MDQTLDRFASDLDRRAAELQQAYDHARDDRARAAIRRMIVSNEVCRAAVAGLLARRSA